MKKVFRGLPELVFVFTRSFHMFFSLGGCCRFEPTCSRYCVESLRAYGFFKGAWLSFKRVLKCRPLGGQGFDSLGQKVG